MFPNMPSGDELKQGDVVSFASREKLRKPKRGPRTRLDLDEYFLKIASVVAERSTCLRHHIGAIAVKDKRILATGYNGAPTGSKDCLELGCMRDELGIPSGQHHEICRAIHAEQNLIIQAALYGVSFEGATIYCTHTPCLTCSRMLVNAKIKRYVSYHNYDPSSFTAFLNFHCFGDFFKEAGIQFVLKERPSRIITYLD